MNTTPAEELESATAKSEQDAQDADDLVETLEQRIAAGDEKVTPDEFERARGLARFARRRRDGAESRKAAALAAARRVVLDELAGDIRAAAGTGGACSPRALEDAKQAFIATVSAAAVKLVAFAKGQEAAAAALHRRAAEIDVPHVEPGTFDRDKPAGPQRMLSGLHAGPSEGGVPQWQLSAVSQFLESDAVRSAMTGAVAHDE